MFLFVLLCDPHPHNVIGRTLICFKNKDEGNYKTLTRILWRKTKFTTIKMLKDRVINKKTCKL